MAQGHQPCPDCGSSDALLINDDGSTKCYSCGKFTPSHDGASSQNAKKPPTEFLKGKAAAIASRNLSKETCSKFKYMTGT